MPPPIAIEHLDLVEDVSPRAFAGIIGIHLLGPITHRVHTTPSDNGKEFAKHEFIAKVLKAWFYSAHPYASWERGLNRNTNGFIRQYFPKTVIFLPSLKGRLTGSWIKPITAPKNALE
jgi:hypothetical protein